MTEEVPWPHGLLRADAYNDHDGYLYEPIDDNVPFTYRPDRRTTSSTVIRPLGTRSE